MEIVYQNDEANIALQDTRALMYGICFCLNDVNPEIQAKAAEALFKLHDPQMIRHWGIGNNIEERGSPEWHQITKLEPSEITYYIIRSFWLIRYGLLQVFLRKEYFEVTKRYWD
jgi:hypothetical protein